MKTKKLYYFCELRKKPLGRVNRQTKTDFLVRARWELVLTVFNTIAWNMISFRMNTMHEHNDNVGLERHKNNTHTSACLTSIFYRYLHIWVWSTSVLSAMIVSKGEIARINWSHNEHAILMHRHFQEKLNEFANGKNYSKLESQTEQISKHKRMKKWEIPKRRLYAIIYQNNIVT